MANVSFLPAAEQDYQAAAGFEAAMEVAVQRIGDSPELSPLCDDRHRFYVLRRYPDSIIYRVDSRDVVVVAVAHARRSLSFWAGRS
jgi:plasmid stabilization system protein ParE